LENLRKSRRGRVPTLPRNQQKDYLEPTTTTTLENKEKETRKTTSI
jgi:hypothetical protein